MRKLLLLTAASGLLVSSALAQDVNAPKPGAQQTQATPATGTPAGNAQVIAAQTADQWLASKFTGTDVLGPDDQKVGDVTDVLFQRDGKVLGYIVSVGGFLGMGAKNVALAPTSFQVIPGQNANDFKLKIAMTKDELKSAAAFEPYKAPPPATTGMGAPRDRVGTPPGRPTGSAQ
jgi:hypothetical protein